MSSTRRGRLTGWERDPGDRYWTPPELADVLVDRLDILPGDHVLEPSVGGGAFARAANKQCVAAWAEARSGALGRLVVCDVDDSAPGLVEGEAVVGDFLSYRPDCRFDWIIGNPPYRQALAHVEYALELGDRIAFLLRLAFLESSARYAFWQAHPCRQIYVLAERPSFLGNGKHDSTAYAFFVWDDTHPGPTRIDVISWRGDSRSSVVDAGSPFVGIDIELAGV